METTRVMIARIGQLAVIQAFAPVRGGKLQCATKVNLERRALATVFGQCREPAYRLRVR